MARWWRGLAVLLLATGCGLLGNAPTRVDLPPPAESRSAIPSTALAHPRTLAWVRRLCTYSSGAPMDALGIARSRSDLPRIEAILAEHGVPRELVAVPAVESRFHAACRGEHGELGIWQLRPATARRFGLQVTTARDDRTHLERATRAAARYLSLLHARYGDWPLALAAYNAGEGRIDRALARRPQATFWELADRGLLPRRSREYVPEVLAVVRLSATPGSCI
jgi:soluble lytic murein transglycosylase-like protein